jgi:small subunit ribosomal protein S15
MPLSTEKKTGILSQFSRDPKDTGSPEVQIALLSERITGLGGKVEAELLKALRQASTKYK